MKKNVLKSIVLFGGILFLAASCVKEIESKNDTYRPAGSPIVFSAATGYDNGVATRTTYSGETVTLSGYSNPFERIDWVSGDKIKVCYFNGGAAAVYTVGSPTADGEKSTADISSQSSMAWAGGTDDHVFYAMYPDATSDSGHGTNTSASLEVSPNGAFVSGLIPAAQTVYQKATGSKVYDADMVYGYLVSKKTIDADSEETSVELPFRPATTTFQFQFKTESGSAAVTSFEMTSATSNLAGNFSFNMLTGADADQRGSASWGEVTVTNASKTITVSFDQAATITADAALDFTVFALPIDITDVTLKFNFTDNTSKTLALKRNDVFDTFTAGKKYIITNGHVPGNSECVYTLTEVDTEGTPIAVTDIKAGEVRTGHAGHVGNYPEQTRPKLFQSYKTQTTGEHAGDQSLVGVKIEFAAADEDGNMTGEWDEANIPDWLSDYSVTDQPETTAPTGTWTSTANYTELPIKVLNPGQTGLDRYETFNEITEHTTILRGRSANGFTSDAPQDLALYDIDKLTATTPNSHPKTANCYVVNRKGWYQFPLVYGNAIDWDHGTANGGWNPTSWKDNDRGETAISLYRLPHFQNFIAQPIRSPYILDDVNSTSSHQGLTADDLEAVIVWEDTDVPFIFADDVELVPEPTTTAAYYDSLGTTTKTIPYVKFRVNDNIMQGNAVIAVREKAGEKRILWSWHIWITDLDMGTVFFPQRGGAVTGNDMMKYNLGWCDMRIGRKYSYVPRICYARISHTEAESNAEPLVFKITEKLDPYYTITQSSGTYYQMGRKDPYLPGTSNEGLCWGWIGYFDVDGEPAPSYSNAELTVPPHSNTGSALPRYINKPVYAPEYSVIDGTGTLVHTEATSSQDNMAHVIQHPNMTYTRNVKTTIGWLYNNRPWNLWDMYNLVNLQYRGSGGTLLSDWTPIWQYDRIPAKTVYDPCPPGFVVPNYAAFSGATEHGSNPHWGPDLNGGGPYDDGDTWCPEDFETFPDIPLYGDYRFYFNSGAGTKSICFPSHGYRSDGVIGGIFGGIYNLTSQKKGDRYCICLSGWGPTGGGNSRQTGFAVRPIKERPVPTPPEPGNAYIYPVLPD